MISEYDASNLEIVVEENQIKFNQPIYLRPTLGERITHFIYKNKLISHGHYRLNRRLCGTDWIDVRALLANYQIGTEIVEIMSKDLEIFLSKNLIESNVLLLGIGMNGNILASRVAFQLNLPFSYLVTSKPGTLGTDMEKSIELSEIRKVVLFTGVISSFDTIKSMVKRYLTDEDGKVKVEVVRIYTVLWRPIPDKYSLSDKEDGIENKLSDKIVYLNEDFPGDILEHEQCLQIKYGKCIARNKQAYEEVYEWPLAVKNNNRVYINNVIGCDKGCRYCYLHNIGITRREIYSASEVVSEFERLNQVDAQNTIISFGCYAECMLDENIENMLRLVKYFSERGYYIQISTKSKIKKEWFEELEKILNKKEQLSIFVSIPTFSRADEYEPGAASVEERIENFKYHSPNSYIKIYMYIKPFLENITYMDQHEYIKLMQKYHMDVIVGKKFQFDTHDGDMVKVGKNEMFEIKSEQLEKMIFELKKAGNVYEHSTDPIRKLLEC